MVSLLIREKETVRDNDDNERIPSIFLRFPFVCVSIGIVIEMIPTIGVVYNPILNEVKFHPLKELIGYDSLIFVGGIGLFYFNGTRIQ